MLVVFNWMKKEFNKIDQEYDQFLIELKKVGINDGVKANLEVSNAVNNETLRVLNEITIELDKENRNNKKIQSLSESLKVCSSKATSCYKELEISFFAAEKQIVGLKKLLKAISDSEKALLELNEEVLESNLSNDAKTSAYQSLQGKIAIFSGYVKLIESFLSKQEQNMMSSLLYIHDTYPRLFNELKVADAKGADLGLLTESKESGRLKAEFSINESMLSAATTRVLESLKSSDDKNRVTLLFRSLLSERSREIDNYKKQYMNELESGEIVKIFDSFVELSDKSNPKFNFKSIRVITFGGSEYINSRNLRVTGEVKNFISNDGILLPSFLLLLNKDRSVKSFEMIYDYFTNRLNELTSEAEFELKSANEHSGWVKLFNADLKAKQSKLKYLKGVQEALKKDRTVLLEHISWLRIQSDPNITFRMSNPMSNDDHGIIYLSFK